MVFVQVWLYFVIMNTNNLEGFVRIAQTSLTIILLFMFIKKGAAVAGGL